LESLPLGFDSLQFKFLKVVVNDSAHGWIRGG
jgi:hypothetical protein